MKIIFILLYGWLSNQIYAESLWTSDFAVEVVRNKEIEAEKALNDNGFKVVRKMPDLDNVYHVRHVDACPKRRCKREATDYLTTLKSLSYIKRVEQQMLLERQLRDFDTEENLDRKEYFKRKVEYQKLLEEMNSQADTQFSFHHDISEDIRKKFEQEDAIYSKKINERSQSNSDITFNDPGWKYQWQLDNHGQLDSIQGVDMNLLSAYSKGYRGENSVVTVVDDGVDTKHPELKPNYDPAASIDLNDPSDLSGNPRSPNSTIPPDEGHGTLCAGEIAAVSNNHRCGVGVAHRANIGGIRLLAGAVTDLLEAFALSHNNQYIMIYSNSWGPKDDGKTLKVPPHYTALALKRGVEKGRGGLGSIFVFASGNGGGNGDSCGLDGFVNSIYTIAVTAVNHHGITPSYTEPCSALSVAVPVGGYHHPKHGKRGQNPKVITSQINGGCKSNFMGTSAATPLAAGCLALALEANPKLTWRDMQHVAYLSSRIPNRDHQVWQRNGAGIPVSYNYGFGLMDCAQLVKNSQTWQNVDKQRICSVKPKKHSDKLEIKARHKTEIIFNSGGCMSHAHSRINRLEHVTVTLNVSHVRRGDLSLWLTSPSGTKAPLLLERKKDSDNKGLNFTFLSLMMWSERPAGRWVLQIFDNGKHDRGYYEADRNRGYVNFASMTLYGTYHAGMSNRPIKNTLSSHRKYGRAHVMSRAQLTREYQARRLAFIKEKPEHKRVHEIKRALKGLNMNNLKNLKKLKLEVDLLSKDKTVHLKDIESLKKELQEKMREFERFKKNNSNNNRNSEIEKLNQEKEYFREYFAPAGEEEILKRFNQFDDDDDELLID